MIKSNAIILFGPISVGKTSIAKELSEALNYNILHADILKDLYYLKYGLTKDITNNIRSLSFESYVKFMRPYELRFLKEILCEYGNYKLIFDFGAGFSYYTKDDDVKVFSDCLKEYQNIFLLLPNKDFEISKKILSERIREEFIHEGVEESKIQDVIKLNDDFISSKSSKLVAKNIIYTNVDSIEQIVDTIKSKLK